MSTSFNIQRGPAAPPPRPPRAVKHFLLEDSDPESHLVPFFKADLPSTRSLISSLGERRASAGGAGCVYEWKDQQDLQYDTPDSSSLIFVQLTIELYSDESKRRVKKNFLGDVEIDLFSLFVGPVRHRLELAHGDRKAVLFFECTVQQESQPTIVIEDFVAPGAPVGASFQCSIPGFCEPVAIALRGPTKLKLAKIAYQDLSEISRTSPLVIRASDGSSAEIGLMDIFLFNEQGDDCKRVLRAGSPEFSISAHLTMANAPRLVQSEGGWHYTENRITKYSGLQYPEGTMTLEDRPDFLFSESDLPCDPPFNPQMTLDPIELKITFTDIRFRITSNPKKYKFLYLTAHTEGYSTASIVFRLNSNDEYVLAGSARPSLRYTTRTPYRLTREGVTFSFTTKPSNVNPMAEVQSEDYARSIVDPVTEVRVPMLRLLSDPGDIKLSLSGQEEGRISIKVESETLQKTIYFSLRNLTISKLPSKARYVLGVKVDDAASIVDTGIDQTEDAESGTTTLSCVESPFFPITFSSRNIVDKEIVVRVMRVNSRRSLKPFKTTFRYCIPLKDLIPLQRETTYTINHLPTENGELEEIPYPFAFTFLLYTNRDRNGYYPEFCQMRELDDDGVVDVGVRKYQPGLVQFIPNGQEFPAVPESSSMDNVRVFFSTVELPSRDLELQKNDSNHCLEFSYGGEPVLSIPLDTVTAISSLSCLLITSSMCRLLLYTPFATYFADVIDKLSGHVSPYLTDSPPPVPEDLEELLQRQHQHQQQSVPPSGLDDQPSDSKLRSTRASDIGSFAVSEYVTGVPDTPNQVFFLPCKCERLYELTCLTCNKPLLDLSLWTLVKYRCQREVPDEESESGRRTCGSAVFFIKPMSGKPLDLESIQCKVCKQFYREGSEQPEILTVFRCSCTACFDAKCPFCDTTPDNLSPYFKKSCKQCNQVLLVTSGGRNCPYCQTML